MTGMPHGSLGEGDIEALVAGRHPDPFAVLGACRTQNGWVLRALVHGAERLEAVSRDGKQSGSLRRVHPEGLFESQPSSARADVGHYLAHGGGNTWRVVDPYLFGPVLGPLDDYYAAEGSHLRLYDKLGAHLIEHEGVRGVHFAVWAPNAVRVSVIGDFNCWDGRRHVMRRRLGSGVHEIFLPDITEGALYKFEIIGADGTRLPLKSDPFAFASQMRPDTASRVADLSKFVWSDAAYLERRAARDPRREPMSIYEVHAGSWQRSDGGGFLTYDELADRLIPYVRDLGYTHIELLPIAEHPLDESWGYQPTGLFAPSARFGEPAGFARLVDRAHAVGLGVILDWVPAHFPTDAHGLSWFDGTALYEHADPRLGFHPDWNTAIYNYGRVEVQAFLINNALFWLDTYHIDGLRVDAVASMLYRDYSRQAGQWVPNEQGGRENTEAVAFLRRMNEVCYKAHPGIVTIAEESTAWPGVSQPVFSGGLGFGFKWNMGFMHDTLQYMARDPIHRRHHHDEITFGLLYAFSENFVLPLSHDEVVHGKGTLLAKMAGSDAEKFAQLRAYYGFMWGYPGKKLLFMGQEFAPWAEWSEKRALDWHLLAHAPHVGMQRLIRDLNTLYRALPALHARDCEPDGFEWLVVDDRANSVYAWLRHSGGDAPPVAVVVNFTPVARSDYRLPLPRAGRWIEHLNTDAGVYGGRNQGNLGGVVAVASQLREQPASAKIHLPPLSTLIFEFSATGD
ncbi:MAG: 1,4-alpha-glucan branching protein GlgB [Hyphomicrobiaceae bacterium]